MTYWTCTAIKGMFFVLVKCTVKGQVSGVCTVRVVFQDFLMLIHEMHCKGMKFTIFAAL